MTDTGISYVFGDATRPQGDGHKVIVHVCNNAGGWGKGFVIAVSKRWPYPEDIYRQAAEGSSLELGSVQIVPVEVDITVANMIAQDGFGDRHGPPIRYEAVRQCLAKVAAHITAEATVAKWGTPTVHMPRIGCGLAGGQWSDIEPIIRDELVAKALPVTVYDLRPA